MTAPRISTPKVFGRQLSLASQFDPLLRNVIPVGVAARFVADSALEEAVSSEPVSARAAPN